MPCEPARGPLTRASSAMRVLTTAAAGFLTLTMIVSGANAQVPGATNNELCSCSPTVFSFTLDFAGSCPGSLVDADGNPINGAILNSSCVTAVVAQDPTAGLQPVRVDAVIIQEFNMDEVINFTTLTGPFEDGAVIVYPSISSYANLTEAYFPFGIQLTLTGKNSDDSTVINDVAVTYTTDCDEWPVYPLGSTIGWVEIVSHLMVGRKRTVWLCGMVSYAYLCLLSGYSDGCLAGILSSSTRSS